MSAVGMGMGKAVYTALPYAVLTLKFASNAAMMAMLRSTLDPVHGVNPVVLAVYQQLASSCVLVSLALLLDRITVAELLLTTSLRYITASVQSVGLNTIPVTVFVLAVLAGRENFAWGSSYGQAKLWGVFASVAGATLVVLASDSDSTSGGGSGAFNGFWLGVLMVAASVLVHSVAYMLVERAAIEYSSDLTLSAMMSSFGMIQMVVVAALMVRDLSSWKINRDTLELPIILFGGIIVTGVFYFGHNWCIHTKGPVFGAAFSPLLVVFSFLLEILFFQSKLDIKSVIGPCLWLEVYIYFCGQKQEIIKKK
ncbi:nodulin MtN21 /EamA-like transporter family protein [Rhynchospora pubera]|uniref:WAT1-related protein n=1 Tax=Rhynchospora pubera TaxID=906938 RepID=A0AAV8DFM7_9POAL|nr:nodulin MtN21 /EamA-like transporter family protein [Rhynchospora pubera]